MQQRQDPRTQQTRQRLRAAAHRLFLQQGYLATSIDAILAEAGVASKETLYRHYANKEALFVDVLAHLTMEQPGFSEKRRGAARATGSGIVAPGIHGRGPRAARDDEPA